MATMWCRRRTGRFGVGILLAWVGAVLFAAVSTQASEPPFTWVPAATFDPNVPGLGLPSLPGINSTIIHTPIPSSAPLDEGGAGLYESVQHGTFNHSPTIALYEDKFLVYWLNHDQDEDAPAQRVLAKVGTFNADQSAISWGGIETLVELAGTPAPVTRRHTTFDPNIISEAAAHGGLQIINDRIYLKGRIGAAHGYSDDLAYSGWRTRNDEPVPAANWSDVKTEAFRFDIYHDLGRFVQNWEIQGNTLQPVTPLYETEEFVEQVEVTPGRFKQVVAPGEPYASAQPFSESPYQMQVDIVDGTPESFLRYPNYAPGTWNLTEDGTNGLAHYTEFQRPDGTWVVVRDNLVNPTNYYAADKDELSDFYPLGVETNLHGTAMPTSGELPDGRPWIIGNNESRKDMYLTLSKDGYLFDESWLLQHSDYIKIEDGYGKGNGGAQYFSSITVGENIWVVYSIGKESIGVMQIPIASLPHVPEPSVLILLTTGLLGLFCYAWRRQR